MDMAKTNVLGGSLAIGHPFGATGARLVATASNRLQRENQRFALLTACADGGLAHACILERGVQALLDHDGKDVETTFGAVFQLSYEAYGAVRTVDLVPGGGQVAVTAANRREYVRLYVQHTLVTSVAPQYEAFARGFTKVCGGDAFDLFQPEELELLVCGNPELDFHDLEAGTTYEDGYEAVSASVRRLWTVLHGLAEPDKRLFLKFVSGSDRSPIDGLSRLGLVVSKNGSDDARLPSAHTCFNHLLLPDYSTIETCLVVQVLRERMLFAIAQSEGFGLR